MVDVLVEVASVVDGDSFRAMDGDEELEVRLLGINAPERDECFGVESAAWLTETMEGKEVGLAIEPEPDQFGRHPRSGSGRSDQRKRGRIELGSCPGGECRKVSTGTHWWRPKRVLDRPEPGCGQTTSAGPAGRRASLEIVELDYNPPGPDENETVTIVNNGSDNIDLDGFVLRDESSINRFVLPRVVLAEGERLTVARD